MVKDPLLIQVDCQHQKGVEELSLATYSKAHQEPHCDKLNYGKNASLERLDYSSQGRLYKIADDIYSCGKPLVDMEFPQKEKQDNPTNVDTSENCIGHVSSHLGGCNLGDGVSGEEAFVYNLGDDGEQLSHSRKEKHFPTNLQHDKLGSCFQQDMKLGMVDNSCNSRDDVRPLNMHSRDEITQGNLLIEAQDKEDIKDALASHVQGQEQHCTLQDLSELACRIKFKQEKFSPPGQKERPDQEFFSPPGQKERPVSLDNTAHLLLHNLNDAAHNSKENGGLSAPGNIEQDHAIALWVKWRGKWQTGIQCPTADCPLATLKAKPTHERKRYIAVFFPRTRTYYWVDMLLIRPIDEFPEPLVNGTHRKWRKLVKDLTIPRRYIMQKLAITMLNFSDRLPTETVIDNARKASTWKEFAFEASCCRGYADLGKMLIKLKNMIIPDYISRHWLLGSFNSWIQRCGNAQNAESIELLTEELMQSMDWKKVDELWNVPVQPELVPEWRTWKQEAMKLFFASHSTGGEGEDHRNCDDAGVELQISRKRPKLEVRRTETCTLPLPNSTSMVFTQDSSNKDTVLTNFACREPCGTDSFLGCFGEADEKSNQNLDCVRFTESCAVNYGRQCSAFIEAKGRQCGRWANDGDIYCCVHLNMRSVEKVSQEERRHSTEAPMCDGLTNHGRKCKHRAQYGSAFCKKHRFQAGHISTIIDEAGSMVKNMIKGEDCEKNAEEIFSNSNAVLNEGCRLTPEFHDPMQADFIPIAVGQTMDERHCLMKTSELNHELSTAVASSSLDLPRCIGHSSREKSDQCQEYAKRHTLYCEKHLPRFLKRARNGKSRLISKEVFLNLLKDCSSQKQKIYLHQACELLYWFLKCNLSRQQSLLKSNDMESVLDEISTDSAIGEHLLKLVSSEREKLMRIWGFGTDKSKVTSSDGREVSELVVHKNGSDSFVGLKCKICAQEFCDDQKLGLHWTDVHKKEARWLFRGYACAICMDSFTNRKVLGTHVQERHGVQCLQNSTLFRCMSCSSNFASPDMLWQHVLSSHSVEFRVSDAAQHPQHPVQPMTGTSYRPYCNSACTNDDSSQKFKCRFCGLRFDLLPDLGRHHQVAHMRPCSIGHLHPRRGKYQLHRSLQPSFRFKKQNSFGIQKNFNMSSNLVFSISPRSQTPASEAIGLGRLLESHCSDVAQALFSKTRKSKSHPSNLDILSIARSSCCRASLHAALENKYGGLPENIYLRAAKLCSEMDIKIDWHQEGFVCPKGCNSPTNPLVLTSLIPLPDGFLELPSFITSPVNDARWEMDENHYILDSKQFDWNPQRNAVVLCKDISCGKERFPIAFVVDDEIKDSFPTDTSNDSFSLQHGISASWQEFTYVTERLIEPPLASDTKNLQLGCSCPHSQCSPENCDHVYLFDNDYENAEDINGKPMHGRFAYNEKGQIVLEEGYLVYECNSWCNCDKSCQNRVLQKGIQVKLEIFRTEKKGWAVRAAEGIPRGTFVCEYIGEVLNDEEAKRRGKRYDDGGCSYLYDINTIGSTKVMTEGTVPYVIDATKYGNVSRFINHSCSPNLVCYLVLVESMDCQLAHVGLYASRDIAAWEELAYNYGYKLSPGDGCPCHCGAPNCRGRLY